MRFGFRIPSLAKRIAARTSVKRIIRHNLGFKAPKIEVEPYSIAINTRNTSNDVYRIYGSLPCEKFNFFNKFGNIPKLIQNKTVS